MEEPGGLPSMGLLRVEHDWPTSISLSCIGEGNGNPLQCSCLEIVPGTGKPGGLPSTGSHRVRHDWNDLAAAAAAGLVSATQFWVYYLVFNNPPHSPPRFSLLLFSHQVMFDFSQPRGLLQARLLRPPLSLRLCSNSCPLSPWCHSNTSTLTQILTERCDLLSQMLLPATTLDLSQSFAKSLSSIHRSWHILPNLFVIFTGHDERLILFFSLVIQF